MFVWFPNQLVYKTNFSVQTAIASKVHLSVTAKNTAPMRLTNSTVHVSRFFISFLIT
jgi:hypothetical protein